MPSTTFRAEKNRGLKASDASKIGPAVRSQLFNVYFAHRMALCGAGRESDPTFQRRVIDLVVINAHRNQADPFGFPRPTAARTASR